MVNSKQKGKRGELEAAAMLRKVFGIDARRSQQFCGVAGDSDLLVDGLHVEVKRRESLSLYEATEQAERACPDDQPWVVLHRRSRKPWLVITTPEQLLHVADVIRQNCNGDHGDQEADQ